MCSCLFCSANVCLYKRLPYFKFVDLEREINGYIQYIQNVHFIRASYHISVNISLSRKSLAYKMCQILSPKEWHKEIWNLWYT